MNQLIISFSWLWKRIINIRSSIHSITAYKIISHSGATGILFKENIVPLLYLECDMNLSYP